MHALDPKKRVVREHLRVTPDGQVEVIIRQSKEIGSPHWTLERGGGRSPRPPVQARPELSENDYAELLLDSERGHASGEMTETDWQRRQVTLWQEIRARGPEFMTLVWGLVHGELSPGAQKLIMSFPKQIGDVVKYWFDTGALGMDIVYGRVTASGPKYFIVRWESGRRNRVSHGNREISFVFGAEELEEAKKALDR